LGRDIRRPSVAFTSCQKGQKCGAYKVGNWRRGRAAGLSVRDASKTKTKYGKAGGNKGGGGRSTKREKKKIGVGRETTKEDNTPKD